MLHISKEDFVRYMNIIEKYREDSDKLSDVISSIGDGYFIFNAADNLMYAISEILGRLTNSVTTDDYGNDIDYYLFEDSKKVWVNEEEFDISTPEKLYDFLEFMDSKC